MDDPSRRALTDTLSAQPDVVFAYLFGSNTRDDAGPLSDVDVAVQLRGEPTIDRRLELLRLVSDALGRDDVDLVVLNEAPPVLGFEALRGELLVSTDEGERVELEARLMSVYHDRRAHLDQLSRES